MKKNSKRKIIALALGTVMILTACGRSPSSGTQAAATTAATDSAATAAAGSTESREPIAGGSKKLTIYTAWPEAELPVYFNAFEQDTGIKIDYVRLSAGEMLARVTAEKDNPQASLMVSASSDTFIMASQDGLFYPYISPESENFPEDSLDEAGYWSPMTTCSISYACNTEWFDANGLEYPTCWADLLKPEFKDQISISHPSTAGTGYTIMASLVEMMGEDQAFDYLLALKNNIRQYTKSGAAPAMEVALGEAAIGIMYDQAGLSAKNQGYPIEIVYPEDGTGYEIIAMAIINNGPADELDNAKTFIDWIMSVRGQEVFIEAKANVVALNVNARIADGLVSPSELNQIPHDAVWSSNNRTRLIEEFIARVDNGESLE